jgi:hypothetical protein
MSVFSGNIVVRLIVWQFAMPCNGVSMYTGGLWVWWDLFDCPGWERLITDTIISQVHRHETWWGTHLRLLQDQLAYPTSDPNRILWHWCLIVQYVSPIAMGWTPMRGFVWVRKYSKPATQGDQCVSEGYGREGENLPIIGLSLETCCQAGLYICLSQSSICWVGFTRRRSSGNKVCVSIECQGGCCDATWEVGFARFLTCFHASVLSQLYLITVSFSHRHQTQQLPGGYWQAQ